MARLTRDDMSLDSAARSACLRRNNGAGCPLGPPIRRGNENESGQKIKA